MKLKFFIFLLVVVTRIQAQINCSCSARQSIKQSAKTKSRFPFDQQKRIQLVYFKAPNKFIYGVNAKDFSWDTTDFIPKTNGDVDTSKFIQKKDLSYSDTDSLINIINSKSAENCFAEGGHFIEPRYGIIFYNNKNEIIDYLVFDIVREGIGQASLGHRNLKEINFGAYCSNKYLLIDQLFKRNGIIIEYTTIEYK